ncbi:Polycystic kidney disease protein 1-like 2 [Liparis tanakae]|uniref:Polycystic kidney disease protein 1-like 2 n=1 Tax=Liparis tanakae TaxID=230148 RepID=A0A4Z2IT96_9TELE|nr:Polycystic kidney disease protein 1-like 2 [Liparis tanakae]
MKRLNQPCAYLKALHLPQAASQSQVNAEDVNLDENQDGIWCTSEFQSVYTVERDDVTCWSVCSPVKGESESGPHWVYCSKFILAALCHLLTCLEKLDQKHFPSAEEYQQTLNTTNQLVRKAEMVFSSHLASSPLPVEKKKKRSASCWLPWWCVFLGWFLLLSISAVSTYFTLLYGFWYGRGKSIKWVMSLGLSLFQSIFVLQPLKVIGVAVFFALLLKPVAVEETDEIKQVMLEQQAKCKRYSGRDTL